LLSRVRRVYAVSFIPKTNTHTRGQATVEFALILVIFFAMLYGILEISRLLFINAELENAAREGVDYASRHPDVTASDLRDNVIGPKLALIDKNSPDFVVNSPSLPRGIGPYYPVQVSVGYTWTSIANIMPDMSNMTLRPLGPLLLTATSTKLIEGR
jgi:TadE-like protein